MPSGAKKRKAAKRKKEKEETHHHHNHHPPRTAATFPHGDDELNHHDDKESDAEEVSSPASEDHPNNHHQFTGGDKEEVENAEDNSHVQSSSEETKSFEGLKEDTEAAKTAIEEKRAGQVERELGPAVRLGGEIIALKEVEPKRESGNEAFFSQTINVESATAEEVGPQKVSGGVLLQRLHEGSVIQIQSDLSPIDELETKNVTVNKHVEPLKERSDKGLLQNQEEEPHVIEKTSVIVDDARFVGSTDTVNSLSESVTEVSNIIPVGDNYKLAVESGSVDEMDKDRLPGGKINGNTSASANDLLTSNVLVLESKKNEENKVILKESNGRMPPPSAGVETVVEPEDVKVSASQETEERLTLSHNAQKADAAKGADSSSSAEHAKESKVPEFSHSQHLGVSATGIVQRTSWMSCCGLFEVFGGSSR